MVAMIPSYCSPGGRDEGSQIIDRISNSLISFNKYFGNFNITIKHLKNH